MGSWGLVEQAVRPRSAVAGTVVFRKFRRFIGVFMVFGMKTVEARRGACGFL